LIKNLCLDFIRSPKNQQDNDLVESIIVTTGTNPESELESKEKMQQLEALIEQLPEKQRIVIRMRGCGDCSLEEIEAVTGESAANVRVLLSRARRTMKQQLTITNYEL
jgi:RNA polymerase sigma-70 factor (ECF subfamily)